MSAQARRYGHNFERYVASRMRAIFPHRKVRRGAQSSMAHGHADVIVEGLGLWIECQSASRVVPAKKLEQAARDRDKYEPSQEPIAITHKRGSPRPMSRVTMYAHSLEFFGFTVPDFVTTDLVSVDLEAFEGWLKCLK